MKQNSSSKNPKHISQQTNTSKESQSRYEREPVKNSSKNGSTKISPRTHNK